MKGVKVLEIAPRGEVGGVISEAPFENFRTSFACGMKVELPENSDWQAIREELLNDNQQALMFRFELLKNKLKADYIQKQMAGIRFREKEGRQYPSVTSILGFDKDFFISDVDLTQYGARGSIVHKLIEHYCDNGKWLDLKELVGLYPDFREDASIMHRGNLGLTLETLSYEKFMEVHEKDFEFGIKEIIIFNDKYLYSGRTDMIGKYKGKKSIIDWKSGVGDFPQLAAYAKGDDIEGIEQLVICPVGKTDNKSGVMKPRVTINIEKEFNTFLKARAKFAERFGI